MAFGTLSNFMSVLLGGTPEVATATGGSSGASTVRKKPPAGTDKVGGPSRTTGTPAETGGVTLRSKPGEDGPQGRQSPTTRFPFGSSILGEGRSLFPDVSVAGGSSTGRQQQPTAGTVRSRRRKPGFGIA